MVSKKKKEEYNRKVLDSILNFDPIAEAEKIHGRNTKESQSAGLANMMVQNELKAKMLDELGDSKFTNDLEDYVRIITGIGFRMILKESFYREDSRKEYFFVYWHDEYGILLDFDTYNTTRVNGSHFNYNWISKFGGRHQFTSSGGYARDMNDEYKRLYHFDENMNLLDDKEIIKKNWKDELTEEEEKYNDWLWENTYGLWVGYHDGREAIKHNISGLAENGNLLSQWIEPCSTLTLCTSDDYEDDKDHIQISLERFKKLPDDVKEKIKFNEIEKNHLEWRKRK